MSSTTKKAPISPESKKMSDDLPTTADLYRNYDEYIKAINSENDAKKRNFAREVISSGETIIKEIEEKNKQKEEKRVELIEKIYNETKETVISLKELKELEYDEVNSIFNNVVEQKKPWWKKFINIFR